MSLDGLDRPALAALAREWLLAGHMIDRAGMPYVIAEMGREAMTSVAIDEWMGASPIYTRRMQRALGFEGDDVTTILKGMQFDIGAPHEFMDFRFHVTDERHGGFHLGTCGALLDVEPIGEEFVVAMCHHIEDPTFDATACATNGRARMRPIHRPPRVPADRLPHCEWEVVIDDDAEPLSEPAVTHRLASTVAAQVELPPIDPAADGESSYGSALDPDLRLDRFSRSALLRILGEVALQGQLLARSFMLAVESRTDAETARRLGIHQLTGTAGLVARRLARHLGAGPDLDGVGQVLAVHPAFHPHPYVSLTDLSFEAMVESDRLSWPALVIDGADGPLAAIVQAVAPTLRVERLTQPGEPVVRWHISPDPDGASAPEPEEVAVASLSTGADFRLQANADVSVASPRRGAISG